ncbi:MAG TPA: ABC transporter permease [Gemmatimonadales bacterium]|nr:ABC transporter permease [Gemmatimonadales bacterium]
MRRLFRLPFRAFAHITRDLDEEVAFHLERRVEDLVAAGMPPDAARAEALQRFGDVEDLRAFCRAVERPGVVRSRVTAWLSDLGQDLRFAGRQFVRSPGFSLLVVATIGLGIGATTTIYCAVHDLLMKPLPYRDADRLVAVDELVFHGQASISPSRDVVDAWRAGGHSLEGIVEYTSAQWTLSGAGEPELVSGKGLAPNLLPFLGVRPLLGRAFTTEDARSGAPAVVMIGEALWRRRFGASSSPLGRTMTIDGRPYIVIGVMPRDFGLALFYDLDQPQVFLPLPSGTGADRVAALGRLRRGVTVDQAARELGALAASDPSMGPNAPGANLVAVRDAFQGWYRSTLTLLLGAVGLVLLIACANVTNLLLMRAWSRQREFGIRTAIGAGRGRLVRQLLTESVLLGLGGGGLGVLLAWRGVPLVAVLHPRIPTMTALAQIRLDPHVLAFALGLACCTGMLFGLAPAWFATEHQMGESLKDTARSTAGRPSSRHLRHGLVVGEVAVSMVLLIAAGLLVRSLATRATADEGLYPAGLLSVELELPADRLPSPAVRAQLLARIVERARVMPGVQAVSGALMSPWTGSALMATLAVQGQPPERGAKFHMLAFNNVTPDYFRAAEIAFLAGRVFSADSSDHEAVVSRAFARQYLPAGAWLGARFRFGDRVPWWTVVGVVADPRLPGEEGAPPQPAVYQPLAGTGTHATILARSESPAALLPFLTRSIVRMEPAIHVLRARTVRMALADLRAEPRFLLTLLGAFAGIALLLATVGLYGVVAYAVRQRTHEIGVRVALGAGTADVLHMVLRHGLALALVGVVLGLAGAAAATRVIRSQLYGVGPGDPATFAVVGALLTLVALVASYSPARAALRISPVEALRAGG